VQVGLFLQVRQVVERATRWLLRNRREPLDIAETVAFFSPGVPELSERLPELLTEAAAEALAEKVARYADAGVPDPLARRIAALPALFSVLDISEVARSPSCTG